MPEDPKRTSEDFSRSGDAVEVGGLGFRFKVTGQLARQVLVVLGIGAGVWYAAYSKPQQILRELHAMRMDILETKVTMQAMTENMTPVQQARVKRVVEEKLAVLKLTEGR